MGVVLMSKRELNRIDVPAMPPSDISTLPKQRHLNLVAT
jgi:hypothetical protein